MSVFDNNTSPIPSFQRVLSACNHAEIDVQMQMIWDCGIRGAVSLPRANRSSPQCVTSCRS